MDIEKIGETFGFLFMFFVSTIILFFILKLLDKLPENWGWFHILNLVFIIVLIGILISRVLQ